MYLTKDERLKGAVGLLGDASPPVSRFSTPSASSLACPHCDQTSHRWYAEVSPSLCAHTSGFRFAATLNEHSGNANHHLRGKDQTSDDLALPQSGASVPVHRFIICRRFWWLITQEGLETHRTGSGLCGQLHGDSRNLPPTPGTAARTCRGFPHRHPETGALGGAPCDMRKEVCWIDLGHFSCATSDHIESSAAVALTWFRSGLFGKRSLRCCSRLDVCVCVCASAEPIRSVTATTSRSCFVPATPARGRAPRQIIPRCVMRGRPGCSSRNSVVTPLALPSELGACGDSLLASHLEALSLCPTW